MKLFEIGPDLVPTLLGDFETSDAAGREAYSRSGAGARLEEWGYLLINRGALFYFCNPCEGGYAWELAEP